MPAGTGWSRFDFVGAIAITGALAGLILAVNRLPRDPASLLGWGGVALSLPLWLVVMRQQTRFPAPFIDNRLLADRRFLTLSTVGLATQGAHFALIFLVPLLLEDLHDLSIIRIGLVLLPGAIAIGLLGIGGGWLGQSFRMLPVLIAGQVLSLTAALVLHAAGVGGSPWLIGLLYAWYAAGYGAANATVVAAATAELPDELAGLGTGVFNLFFFMGGAISVAIAGTIVRSRQGQQAWNPLFEGEGSAFSDALLVVVALVVLALLLAIVTASRDRAAARAGKGARGAHRPGTLSRPAPTRR
jgi:MFS family permease